MRTKSRTPKMKQPKLLKIIHPTPLITAPESSSREQQGTPIASRMYASKKRKKDSTVKKSSSTSSKRAKIVVPVSVEELSK